MNLGSTSAKKARLIFIALIVATALYACLINSSTGTLARMFAVHAQEQLTGDWSASLNSDHQIGIDMRFSTRDGKNEFDIGRTFEPGALGGLGEGELRSATRTNVTFRLVRDAGTIECTGTAENGHAAGTWTFKPDAKFAGEMQSRGFTGLRSEDLMMAAFRSLTVKYVDDMRAAGFQKATFDDLSRGSGHDVSVAYVNDLRSSGFDGLSMDDVVRAHNHEINGTYIADVRSLGLGAGSMDDVIRLKNHEIDRDYIDQMRSAGLDKLSTDDVIRLKNHDVSPKFASDVRAEGFSVDADTLIRLRNANIDPDVLRKAKAQYPDASLEDVIRLARRGSIK